MKNVVQVEWLKDHLKDETIRIFDCRFQLGQPQAGFNSYMEDHIPGALYFDLEKDLSSPASVHGGRHPLPDFNRLSDKLSTAGIDNDTTLVIYDDQDGIMASRFWWTLTYLGHKHVFILDGGYSKWKETGYPISDDIPHYEKKNFKVNKQEHLLSSMKEVKAKKENENVMLIDSRVESRYLGINETIDKIGGHIPGAKNYFWKEVLREDGYIKNKEELKAHFKEIDPTNEVIVYCGSGVSACPNILALNELGYNNVKLYVGSWSDWITYPDNEVSTSED